MDHQEFLKKILELKPEADISLIQQAYDFASEAHEGQLRKSGEDYFNHCIQTALVLAELRLDSTTIAAGLLHDVVDDTTISNDEIKKIFGAEIAYLIEGVTKLGKLKYRGLERQVENLRKMFLAMAEDIRVILVKLADRLHNMRTLSSLPEEKQRRIALETLEIYAPLAHRLGLGRLKGELEDLAFYYVYPKEYAWLIDQVKDHFEEREKYLDRIKPLVEKELVRENIPLLEIHTRAKHHYSLYRKLQKHDMDLNRIYDLVALRVIVPDVEKSYAALGIVHKLWRPLPGRIKDYIAMPKINGYRSLHTTVFGENGKITEVQIKTPQMHEEAENGIAAHWVYAGVKNQTTDNPSASKRTALSRELEWVRQLREWQKEIDLPPAEFLESLKIDFFKDRIFVFTPKGDVFDLPEGATPIDFAYRIHTDIGHQCAGAKIDGKIASLDESLQNGQIVEIVTKKQKGPNKKWLEFAKTSLAKSHIKSWVAKRQH